MKHFFTLLALAMMSSGYAQVPESLVGDGLVAWWPFDGNFNDFSGNNNHCIVNGSVPFVEDRNAIPSAAISFSGNGSNFLSVIYSQESFTFTEGLSISAWVNSNSGSGDRRALQMGGTDASGKGFHILKRNTWLGYKLQEGGANDPAFGLWSGSSATTPINLGEWHHVVFSVDFASLQWNTFLDGVLVESGIAPIPFENNQIPLVFTQTFEIGRKTGNSNNGDAWSGFIDDVGIWNRALNQDEVMTLFNAPAPASGCTDENACNYNFDADFDDGICIYPPIIDLGENVQTCEDSVVLDAGEGFNFYEWSTGETTQTIVVTETGEYAVSASNVIDNNHALQFNGTDATGAPAEPILFGTESFSVSVDCKLNAFKGNDSEPYSYIIGHPLTQGTGDHGFKIQTAETSLNGGFQVHINDEGTTHFNVISFDNGMETNVELDQWYDLTMVVDRDNAQFSFYVDGVLIETQTIHPEFGNVDHPNGMSLGVQSIHGSSLLNGDLDNLQIWDVALSAEEVAHWQTTVPSGSETGLIGYWNFEEGEGDEAYDLSHVAPNIALNNVGWTDNTPSDVFDASCASSDTIQVSWLIRGCTDPDACNYVEDASCDDGTCASCEALQTACGPGTIWDAEMQMCIGDGSGDINLDGCVQLNDLLDLLSAYGNCAADESVWQCGDPLEYQGYDYETVQIGEQCWFAENLRSENYENGDEIPSNLGNSEWSSTISGATAIYEESASNLETYGRLYNWHAVDDARGLCPSGWHVPGDGDWTKMEVALGMSEAEANTVGYRGTDQGTQMKSEYGWDNGGNGTNSSGFSALAGGYRFDNGGYAYQGSQEGWWSSTPFESYAWHRFLFSGYQNVYRETYHLGSGFAIRCIQNTD